MTHKLSIKQIIILAATSQIFVGCALFQSPPPPPVKPVVKTKIIPATAVITPLYAAPSPTKLITSSIAPGVTQTTKHLRSHKRFLAKSNFDFIYNGDASDIPQMLQRYDSSIRILPFLGRRINYDVNLDLSDTSIDDIINYLDRTTNGRVKLDYNYKRNTLRLIYDSKVSVANSAINESLKWQDGGTPSPVLKQDGVVLFPYGVYEPKITCQPLNLCDIQLEKGEVVKGLIIGDSVNWNEGDGAIPVVYSGSNNAPVPHIVLKPSLPGLNTSLLITTDKRTYYIKLYSSTGANLSRVGFYYPGEETQTIATQRTELKAADDKVISTPLIDPRNMHFGYKISGDTDAPFNPTQVFDDGTHVYVQMKDGIKANELPAFYVLGNDGKTLELVNFRYKTPFYIIDKLFKKGVLVLGLDGDSERITITKKDE